MDIQTDKSSRVFIKIANRIGFDIPKYAMQYSWPDPDASSKLSDAQFADTLLREYPVDSKAATWLSAAYALHSGVRESDPAVWNRIVKAAAAHNIVNDIVRLSDCVAAGVKEAAARPAPETRALPRAAGCSYPVFDAAGVKHAAEYFTVHRMSHTLSERRAVAGFILSKAAEHGVNTSSLPDCVRREAGHGMPLRDELAEELDERAKLAADQDSADVLANIAKLLSSGAGNMTEYVDKVAEILEDFDTVNGLREKYGSSLRPPADFLYGKPVESFSRFADTVIELGGYAFDASKLAKVLSDDDLREVCMGLDKAASVRDASGAVSAPALKRCVDSMATADKSNMLEVLLHVCEK